MPSYNELPPVKPKAVYRVFFSGRNLPYVGRTFLTLNCTDTAICRFNGYGDIGEKLQTMTSNFVNYVFLLLCMFCSVYSVLLCCSVYCLCVNVYCTTATGCQPNCG